MLAKVNSGTTIGLDGVLIEVEVDVAATGFPTFTIVGLANKAVEEAKERVRAAIINAGFDMPDSRLTVNLAPADIPKAGSSLDLPIAVAILAASGMIDKNFLASSLFVGELSLEGNIRRSSGVISIALMAKKNQVQSLFFPRENKKEVALVAGMKLYAANNLLDVVLHLNGQKPLVAYQPQTAFHQQVAEEPSEFDLSEVRGQEQVKRALEIAACGFHNIHLKGPPGTGKTMLSRSFPSILPPMEREEMLEVSKIYSVAGLHQHNILSPTRPFRAPHHTISRIGLIGGGSNPGPGEISLAHRGVLFMDEFPEFPHAVLEALRQPLEDGVVTISRAAGSLTFPCRFLLIAASNPCPCGYLGHPKRSCKCMPGAILKYRKRLSGPLLDRIDLHVDVPPLIEEKLTATTPLPTSREVRARVIVARVRQHKRLLPLKIRSNSQMTPSDIKKVCVISEEATTLLKQAIDRLSLSARSYFRIIKLGQTIADLADSAEISASHVAEALQYRAKED